MEYTNEDIQAQFSEQHIQAAKVILEYADLEPTLDNVRRYLNRDVLSFTEDEKGHYCWYLDDEGNELCIRIETMEEMDIFEFE